MDAKDWIIMIFLIIIILIALCYYYDWCPWRTWLMDLIPERQIIIEKPIHVPVYYDQPVSRYRTPYNYPRRNISSSLPVPKISSQTPQIPNVPQIPNIPPQTIPFSGPSIGPGYIAPK